jgi:hypothetical protein
LYSVIAAAAGMPAVAQTADAGHSRGSYLFGGAASFGYSSLGPMQLAGNMRGGGLRPDYFASSSLMVGYTSSGAGGALSLNYTPTYLNQFRYSESGGFNQTLSFGVFRRVSSKTSASFGLSGSDSSVAQFAFTTGTLSRLAAAPGTAEALASAIIGRQQTDVDLASVLSTPGTTGAAAQAALYGTRVLSAGTTASVSYSRSPRLTMFVSGSANRSQPLSTGTTQTGGALALRSTTAEARTGLSYGSSGRTTLGLSGGYRRSQSQYAESDVTDLTASVGRQLSRRWFAEISGGAARVENRRASLFLTAAGMAPQMTFSGGGNLGFRARAHTLLARYGYGAGDTYGMGAGRSQSTEGAWSFGRPGQSWTLTVSGAREQMTGAIQDLHMWRAEATLRKSVSPHLAIAFSTSWIESSTRGASVFPMVSGYYARVNLIFSRGGSGARRP